MAGSDPLDLSRFTEAQDRLREWTRIVLTVEGRSAQEIFGYPDYLAAGRASVRARSPRAPATRKSRRAPRTPEPESPGLQSEGGCVFRETPVAQ